MHEELDARVLIVGAGTPARVPARASSARLGGSARSGCHLSPKPRAESVLKLRRLAPI
jgi:hypothetical protein